MRINDKDIKFNLDSQRALPNGACQMTISATFSGKTVKRQVCCECANAKAGKCTDACFQKQLSLQWPNGKQLRGMLAEDLNQALIEAADRAAGSKATK